MFEAVSLLKGRIQSSTHEIVISIAIYAIVALLGLTAYGALLYALGLAISNEAGPMVAALAIAGLTVFLALVALLVLKMRERRLRRLRMLRTRSAMSAGTSAAMTAVVPMMVRASPVGSLLAVGVLAYVMSRAGHVGRRSE